MKFTYDLRQDHEQSAKHTFLSASGLGGYCSLNALGGVSRCDQGVLVSALRAPDLRISLVHRLRETLVTGDQAVCLTQQSFDTGLPREEGCWQTFSYEAVACWEAALDGISLKRRMASARDENSTAVVYEITNSSDRPCTLAVEPMLKLASKEEARQVACPLKLRKESGAMHIESDPYSVWIHTDGQVRQAAPRWERLSYPEDEKDGRPGSGLAGSCCEILFQAMPGETLVCRIVFSDSRQASEAIQILESRKKRCRELQEACGLSDPIARQLALAADDFICRRDSTGGKTIVAGYPLFSDWGRDTMIALPGLCLVTGRYADARSILRTFMAHERRGLMPNLFPEGGTEPLYNTADAALLFIDAVWQYYSRTRDLEFAREAWPVMQRIERAYREGTDHGIRMDEDGLIRAGQDLDQVTWMDVRIGDELPTPRHGKPVEINAYWYNALRILELLAFRLGEDPEPYGKLAARVRTSFRREFYLPVQGWLRDVISGTEADEQLRCNQIWALSMSYTMLEPDQERSVVDAVKRHLFTDHGLRSLSPMDPHYHPHYGGDQYHRDMAYHQGTAWVFPLGGFYRAYLRTHGNSLRAAKKVRGWLAALEPMLKEGCAGQLPEIYDGTDPEEGKGCFAQAWSVGELLTVYEALEQIENGLSAAENRPKFR